jgi:hypothetical protein
MPTIVAPIPNLSVARSLSELALGIGLAVIEHASITVEWLVFEALTLSQKITGMAPKQGEAWYEGKSLL